MCFSRSILFLEPFTAPLSRLPFTAPFPEPFTVIPDKMYEIHMMLFVNDGE